MSDDAPAPETDFWKSIHRAQAAVQSLSLILGPLPDPVLFSENPALSLLHDHTINTKITRRLRLPNSGAGDDSLCRWLYDTFQSTDPSLQLAVLKFIPTIAGVYLCRALSRQPLAGFEAVLLAIYAHETTSRAGQPMTVAIPNLSNPSPYHEVKVPTKSSTNAGDLVGVLSPALEPHGTVRSTKRARIVGVALELYYSKIIHMPTRSKINFCEVCTVWAGKEAFLDDQEMIEGSHASYSSHDEQSDQDPQCDQEVVEERGCRIPLPWELFQPVLRIVGHCLLGPSGPEELKEKAAGAARCLYVRAMHDMSPREILASRSLLRLAKVDEDVIPELSVKSCTASTSSPEMDAAETLLI